MMRKWLAAWSASVFWVALASHAVAAPRVVSEKFMIPALDPGIELQVLNRHPAGEQKFVAERIVLFAPVWLTARGPQYQGSYRTGTRESIRTQTTAGLPKERLEEISPTGWYDKW